MFIIYKWVIFHGYVTKISQKKNRNGFPQWGNPQRQWIGLRGKLQERPMISHENGKMPMVHNAGQINNSLT